VEKKVEVEDEAVEVVGGGGKALQLCIHPSPPQRTIHSTSEEKRRAFSYGLLDSFHRAFKVTCTKLTFQISCGRTE